jgi:hypothetical protein
MTSRIEISISDRSEFRSLREWLGRIPDVRAEQLAGTPVYGEQGAADVLTVLASSGGALAVAIRALPAFIRSRRSDVAITVRLGEDRWTVTTANVNDVLPVIEKVLRAIDTSG